jgi:hypothetical protein
MLAFEQSMSIIDGNKQSTRNARSGVHSAGSVEDVRRIVVPDGTGETMPKKKLKDEPVLARPPTRRMTVIAQDPSVRRGKQIVMATIDVPAEPLAIGPIGYRVQIVDYDSTQRVFHGRHDLPAMEEDEPKSWHAGNPSIQKDFRFHAQNTYALVMKTLARFEFALGRRIPWSFRTHQLKIAPHGMADANAFYSPEAEGLVFGYFKGLSGEAVYTCLSHDVVVHETTHALLDALRERYMDPSNPDQAAFHEGFSDVIALLSVFSQHEVVEHLLLGEQQSGKEEKLISRKDVLPEALRRSALFGLADQMGNELEGVRGGALRSSATIEPDPSLKDTPEFLESHRRGELFVAAVMHAFIEAWSKRILGSGLPDQKKFPLRRVAEEGADIADTLATLWIRAIDYMPPVHLRFGDALSAALTADHEVRPNDSRYDLRRHLLESFATFGFRPASKRADGRWSLPPEGLSYDRVRFESLKSDEDEVFRFLWDNREKLQLRDGAYTKVMSVRPSIRIGVDGFVVRETVAEYYQVAHLTAEEMKELGVQAPREYLQMLEEGLQAKQLEDLDDDEPAPAQDASDIEADTTALHGGAVLIFDEFGRLKYWVHNDVFGKDQRERLAYLWQEGLLQPVRSSKRLRAARLSTLHRLRALNSRIAQQDRW